MADDALTDPMAEINAMKGVAEALAGLDAASTTRVLQWAGGRYGVSVGAPSGGMGSGKSKQNEGVNATNAGDGTLPEFSDFAELYSAAAPTTDADRALVAGYWYQFIEGQDDLVSQTLNSALKNLGHGVGNITGALESLKGQTPSLVMQVRKAGTSRQARKKYKLTAAGKKAVELLLSNA